MRVGQVAVAGSGEDAVVAGGALVEGDAGEEGEEVEVVAVVCGQRREAAR